jgi:hypothetical protein
VKKSFNKSKDQKSFVKHKNENIKISLKINEDEKSKDSKSEINCPEDLHYFYVNLSQKNKKLYYKFDKILDKGKE